MCWTVEHVDFTDRRHQASSREATRLPVACSLSSLPPVTSWPSLSDLPTARREPILPTSRATSPADPIPNKWPGAPSRSCSSAIRFRRYSTRSISNFVHNRVERRIEPPTWTKRMKRSSAEESDEKSFAREGRSSQVLPSAGEHSPGGGPALIPPGEGIGQAIVKHLGELLDASLEIASSAEVGTTFRIVPPPPLRLRRIRNNRGDVLTLLAGNRSGISWTRGEDFYEKAPTGRVPSKARGRGTGFLPTGPFTPAVAGRPLFVTATLHGSPDQVRRCYPETPSRYRRASASTAPPNTASTSPSSTIVPAPLRIQKTPTRSAMRRA
jgi:hypothetical protein